MGWVKCRRGHKALLPAGAAYQFRNAGKPGVLLVQTIHRRAHRREVGRDLSDRGVAVTSYSFTEHCMSTVANTAHTLTDKGLGYRDAFDRRLHVRPRRVLRPHLLSRRPAHHADRRVPARADARRRVGLLLRDRELRQRVRHREPLRHRRDVHRPLQRGLPQQQPPPRRDLRGEGSEEGVRGDARGLDERGLRSVRRAGRDRHARSARRRAATRRRSRGSAWWPTAWSGCRATSALPRRAGLSAEPQLPGRRRPTSRRSTPSRASRARCTRSTSSTTCRAPT